MEAGTLTPQRHAPPRAGIRLPGVGAGLGRGMVVLYLSLIVLLPLAALADQSLSQGLTQFWDQVTQPQAVKSLELTLLASTVVVLINAVFGTILAWLLVRDEFPGKGVVNAVIDLPFALPTIVASLILIELWGDKSPFGVHIAGTRAAVVVALLFVTLPFVVRAVQPLLMEMDREMEEAAASLGAGGLTVFRRIIFPNLLPGLGAGIALAFARALGEFGSVLLFAGGLPDTQVSSVYIKQLIENGNDTGAAAVSVVLLAASLACLVVVSLIQRWSARHERSSGGGLTSMPVSGEMAIAPEEADDERQ
jgi:sulfate/thiosulfate transport system permease protein